MDTETLQCFRHVLGSSRTGLIFTGLQEGAQPGGLTPPGQTEPGIPHHMPSRWVPVGGSQVAGTQSRVGSAQRRLWRAVVLCGQFCFVYSPFLYRCCSCSLCLLFCQSALIPTHRFLPVSFHSPPHFGGGRGGHMALLLPAAAKL